MPFISKKAHVALWVIQGILTVLFLFAGGFKLATPVATLAKLSPLPAPFFKFIGVCEVAGALGLILPGVLRVRTDLTALAALGLVIIMIGAVVTTVVTAGLGPAVLPFAVGVLAAIVARGRWEPRRLAAAHAPYHTLAKAA